MDKKLKGLLYYDTKSTDRRLSKKTRSKTA